MLHSMRFQFFETFIIGNAELPNSQAGKELGLLAVSLHGKDSQNFQAESSEFSFSFIHEGLDRLPTVISQTNSPYTFQSLLCMTSQFVFPIEYHCMMVYEETSGLKREPKTDKKDCTLFSTCSFISFRFVQNSSYISCATTFTYHLRIYQQMKCFSGIHCHGTNASVAPRLWVTRGGC